MKPTKMPKPTVKPTKTPKPTRTAKPTVKPTKTPKPTTTPTPAPKPADPDFTLLARMTVSGNSKTALKLAWTAVKGADGYDVFFAECNNSFKLKKTVEASESRVVRFRDLDKRESYKGYVRAWKRVDGQKIYIGKASLQVHAVSGGYTNHACNTRSVKLNRTRLTLKVSRSRTLKAKLKGVKPGMKLLDHVPRVRFYSTDANVATVDDGGTVKAVGKGSCTVYAIANNGVRSKVKVTVK
ncbi:MAG: Ig-like domain-containing protein [Clostridia bacterium]|nr:Ig-like domain-containing protein [Clostridia bacterium]